MDSKVVIGLDVGITSVGWAVVDMKQARILGRGVRVFSMPNQAADRRLARSARRRLARKVHRKEKIRRLFMDNGMFASTSEAMNAISDTNRTESTWALRAKGLYQLLSAKEWAKVLYHISNRRGFQTNRRLDSLLNSADEKKAEEQGKVSQGESRLAALQKEGNYKTVGETIACHPAFVNHKRNRDGYQHKVFVNRSSLIEETEKLFEAQRSFGSPYATESMQQQFHQLAFTQLPFSTRKLMWERIGFCTHIRIEKRAPKNSITHERFVAYQTLNNLRIQNTTGTRSLTPDEKQVLLHQTFKSKSGELKYKQIRKALSLTDQEQFTNLPEKKGDPEDRVCLRLSFTNKLEQAISNVDVDFWNSLTIEQKDQIGLELTLCKEEKELRPILHQIGCTDAIVNALLELHVSGFGNLSLLACQQLIPHLEQGLSYAEAVELAGFKIITTPTPQLPLPPIDSELGYNKVVMRALTQAKKTLNAVIREFGEPDEIHLEMARDLNRSEKERKEVIKQQEKRRKEKDSAKEHLKKETHQFQSRQPNSKDLLKYELYKEQGGICIYSGQKIDLNKCYGSESYADIDHILPFSRTWNDKRANQVLCLSDANREKGNRTPFEWLGSTSRWDDLLERINNMKLDKKKRMNLLRESLDTEQFNSFTGRMLNDTRYIAKAFKSYIETYAPMKNRHVVVMNGELTAWLRSRYGLGSLKDRNNHEHHALDAILVAVSSQSLIQTIANWSKRNELRDKYVKKVGNQFVHTETGEILEHRYNPATVEKHVPGVWEFFREEVMCWFGIHPLDKQEFGEPKTLIQSLNLPNYTGLTNWNWVTPLLVSRAEDHHITGKAHKETVERIRVEDDRKLRIKTVSIQKIVEDFAKKTLNIPFLNDKHRLSEPMTTEQAEIIVKSIYGNDRNVNESLRNWLTSTSDLLTAVRNAQFPRKYAGNGKIGPEIRKIKRVDAAEAKRGVFRSEHRYSENESMLAIDVFELKGKKGESKYYSVPIYPSDTVKSVLPTQFATPHESHVTDQHNFCFRLFKGDLVHALVKSREYLGYFKSAHASTGGITIETVNSTEEHTFSTVQGIQYFEKYRMDVLGRAHRITKEPRTVFRKST